MDLKDRIYKTAQLMVDESGLINLSRADLCHRVGIPPGSFTHIVQKSFGEFCFDLKPNRIGVPLRRKRVDPGLRRESIIEAAMELKEVTLKSVSGRAGVSTSLIINLFGTIQNLKEIVDERTNQI